MLVNKVQALPAEDIIFDLNIFPVATGMEEHRKNALILLKLLGGCVKIYLMLV